MCPDPDMLSLVLFLASVWFWGSLLCRNALAPTTLPLLYITEHLCVFVILEGAPPNSVRGDQWHTSHRMSPFRKYSAKCVSTAGPHENKVRLPSASEQGSRCATEDRGSDLTNTTHTTQTNWTILFSDPNKVMLVPSGQDVLLWGQ